MQVSWYETDSNTGTTSTMSGVIDAVVMRDGEQFVQIGDKFVKVDELTSVSLPDADGNSAELPGAEGSPEASSGDGSEVSGDD